MSTSSFALGQRWISDTEAELGLGIISDISNRRVAISFPAAAERRLYAAENAPISRVRYQPGDSIRNTDGESIIVEKVEELSGYLIYLGNTESGKDVALPEIELDSFVQFSTPASAIILRTNRQALTLLLAL